MGHGVISSPSNWLLGLHRTLDELKNALEASKPTFLSKILRFQVFICGQFFAF